MRFIDRFARFANSHDEDYSIGDGGLAPNEDYNSPKTMTVQSKMNDDDDDDNILENNKSDETPF